MSALPSDVPPRSMIGAQCPPPAHVQQVKDEAGHSTPFRSVEDIVRDATARVQGMDERTKMEIVQGARLARDLAAGPAEVLKRRNETSQELSRGQDEATRRMRTPGEDRRRDRPSR